METGLEHIEGMFKANTWVTVRPSVEKSRKMMSISRDSRVVRLQAKFDKGAKR
jgi:hypothetical protein